MHVSLLLLLLLLFEFRCLILVGGMEAEPVSFCDGELFKALNRDDVKTRRRVQEDSSLF